MADPQQLGKYRIVATLGSGGFATVYKARHTILERDVALKVLHPALLVDRSFVERFFREARTVARLRHPGIIEIYDVDEADGRAYIAMDLAAMNLAAYLADQGPLPWPEALALLRPIAEALDYAHQHGVVHRDLKPANILLAEDGRPLICDFGFARLASQSSASLSLSGGILGTPGYIAPEVWETNAAEAPADRYALACIAYELLTGDVLFKGATPIQAMRAHDRGPQFLAAWPAGVPPGVAGVLAQALCREPQGRYQSAKAFWEALEGLGTPASRPDPAPASAPVRTAEPLLQQMLGQQPAAEAPPRPAPNDSPPSRPSPPPTEARAARAERPGAPRSPSGKARPRVWPWISIVGAVALLGVLGFLFTDGGFQPPIIPTTTSSAGATSEPTGVTPLVSKVGLVTVGPAIPGTSNGLALQGVERATVELGIEKLYRELSPEGIKEDIQFLVAERCDVIITVGPFIDETTASAAEHPEITFIAVDQPFKTESVTENLVSLQFAEDEMGFLAGALAAMMSGSGTVGIIPGPEDSLGKKFKHGFDNGVRHVYPDHTPLGDFFPIPDNESEARAAVQSLAEQLHASGADVIFGASAPLSSSAISFAAQSDVFVIGVNQDEYLTTFGEGRLAGADKILSSVVKRVDNAVYQEIRAAAEGTFKGNRIERFDMSRDGVGLAPFHETEGRVSAEVRDWLERIRKALADDTLSTGVDPLTGDPK